MNKTSLIYPIIIFFLIFLLSLNEVSLAQDRPQIPNFSIRNLSGELFESGKHLGQPLVLSFFFIPCPPCYKEMPALYEFMRQEGRLKQLLFVDPYVKALENKNFPIEKPNTERQIRNFADDLNIPLQNVYFDVIGTLVKKMKKGGTFPKAKRIGIYVIFPTIIVIDGSGKLVLSIEGPGPDFLEKIRKVL